MIPNYTSTCTLSTPATAAFDKAAACAPCPDTAALRAELTGDRHPVRTLDNRRLHGPGYGNTAIDVDVLAWDRGVAILDLHLIGRGS